VFYYPRIALSSLPVVVYLDLSIVVSVTYNRRYNKALIVLRVTRTQGTLGQVRVALRARAAAVKQNQDVPEDPITALIPLRDYWMIQTACTPLL
jgi:hypothetical protein